MARIVGPVGLPKHIDFLLWQIEGHQHDLQREKFRAFAVEEGAATNNLTIGDEALRARFDAGVTAFHDNGTTLRLEIYYDGLGADDYDAWGGMATLAIPL